MHFHLVQLLLKKKIIIVLRNQMEGITQYTQHYINNIDVNREQKCKFCGAVIIHFEDFQLIENQYSIPMAAGPIYVQPGIVQNHLPPYSYYVYCSNVKDEAITNHPPVIETPSPGINKS